MRRAEEPWVRRRRALDRRGAALEVIANVGRRLEVQLAVIVAVIADRVAFVGDARHEIGPLLGVSAENEERGLDSALAERVENQRRRVGVRARRRRSARPRRSRARKPRDGPTEDRTVAVKRAVRRAAEQRDADAEPKDHTPTATFPRTF